ncbi:MAG: hypothetical protein QM723_01595 [Myxococcaceae bacterium]
MIRTSSTHSRPSPGAEIEIGPRVLRPRRPLAKQLGLQRLERGVSRHLVVLRAQGLRGGAIGGRKDGEQIGGALGEPFDEAALGRVLQGDVEQQHRSEAFAHRVAGALVGHRVIRQALLLEGRLVLGEGGAQLGRLGRGLGALQPQLLHRLGQRERQAGAGRDRLQPAELVLRRQLLGHPRPHRVERQPRSGHPVFFQQSLPREPRRQRQQGDSLPAERRAARGAHQVGGALPIVADHVERPGGVLPAQPLEGRGATFCGRNAGAGLTQATTRPTRKCGARASADRDRVAP